MTDEMLIQHCAPTLAGLKTGNLFTFRFSKREDMIRTIRHYNAKLQDKGIRMIPLRYKDSSVLLYVYRPEKLKRDLSDMSAQSLLKEHGYSSNDCTKCIREIIRRINEGGRFPHEIGLFLSYPPEDVRGFIEQRASNCKACGLWKVYGDVKGAQSSFARYERCIKQYKRAWESGLGLEVLAVKL